MPITAQNPISVKVLTTLEELESIRAVWESWPGNRDSEIDSYLTVLRFNEASVRPHVIVIERDGKSDAIFVGRLDDTKVICRVGYWHFSMRAKVLAFVNGALRGNASDENCDLVIASIRQSLRAGDADTAYLTFLREGSRICRLAMTKPGILSRDFSPIGQDHFAAQLPTSIEEFHRTLSTKVRKNQKWQAKKLAEHFSGDVVIRCFREVAEVDELIATTEQLASKSYQRGIGAGFRDVPVVRAQLRLKAERGWLRGHVLYLGGEPCAFWIGDVNNGTFGSDFLGYDPAFAKHSPGMFLIMKVVEGFCDGGHEVRAIDFGPGPAQYKEVLSTEVWQELSIYIFAATFRGCLLNLLRTTTSALDRLIKALLIKTGLLQRVKKAWRARATPVTADGTPAEQPS